VGADGFSFRTQLDLADRDYPASYRHRQENAIMMIDVALELERKENLSPEESIFQACLLRFRPIMMTTAAAILGGLPLALSHGAGSEIRIPLGVAIVGGLIVSQVLTLYTTPVVYLYLERGGKWIGIDLHGILCIECPNTTIPARVQ